MATHTVRRGDTLWALARQHGTTVAALVRANALEHPDQLRPGQILHMPGDRLELSPAARPAPGPMKPVASRPVRPGGPRREWTEEDVEVLARALSAEARSVVSRYRRTGAPADRDAVLAAGFVIAETAASRGLSIAGLLAQQPLFLSSWGLGEQGGNADNFAQFFLPRERIAHYAELEAIARDALAGKDPTGMAPNHFYDDSIAPPAWAHTAQTTKIGEFIFARTVG